MPIDSHNLASEARGFTRELHLSFETGEQGAHRLRLPSDVEGELIGLDNSVTKNLAGTDAGTITVADSSGNTIASLSLPASTAAGTHTADPTAALTAAGTDALMERRRIRKGGYLTVTPAKTTAGGKVWAQLHFLRLPTGATK